MTKFESKSWTVGELLDALEGRERSEEITFVRPDGKPMVECWCGCGGETKSRFCPGHDAKLHSLAKKVARGQENGEEIVAALPHEEAVREFYRHVKKEEIIQAARKQAEELEARAKAEAEALDAAEVEETEEVAG